MSDYFDRNIVHLDGTRVFQTEEDRRRENEVARFLEQHWHCELRHFGALSPIDWYAVRHDRVVGVAELKSRNKPAATHAWLAVRKWLALTLAQTGLGVPAAFVVKFTDFTFWAPLNEVDPRNIIMGGAARAVKTEASFEPIIEVSLSSMRCLTPLN